MTVQVSIPALGFAVTEGELVEWLVDDGQQVDQGTALYVLETDKVQNEIESPAAGIVRLIGVVGETYQVGEVIAEIT